MSVRRFVGALLVLLSMGVASSMPIRLEAQTRAKTALSVRRNSQRLPARWQGAPPRDRWFGRDKFRHAGSAAAIQIMGFGLLRLVGASRRASFAGASVVTVGASIGKEIRDARGGGDPSARDLVWDAVGLGLGSAVVAAFDPP